MKFSFLLFCCLLSLHAQSQISFREMSARGSGCPEGSVQYIVSPDEGSLSILFDEFRSEVPNYETTQRHPRDRRRDSTFENLKSCALSFTALIPENHKLEALEVSFDVRGSAYLDQGVDGLFASILVGYQGMANSRGRPQTIFQNKWRSQGKEFSEEFYFSPKVEIPMNSSCSQRQMSFTRFDLKNHLKTEIISGDSSKQGSLTIDSLDSRHLMKVKMKIKRCGRSRLTPSR